MHKPILTFVLQSNILFTIFTMNKIQAILHYILNNSRPFTICWLFELSIALPSSWPTKYIYTYSKISKPNIHSLIFLTIHFVKYKSKHSWLSKTSPNGMPHMVSTHKHSSFITFHTKPRFHKPFKFPSIHNPYAFSNIHHINNSIFPYKFKTIRIQSITKLFITFIQAYSYKSMGSYTIHLH